MSMKKIICNMLVFTFILLAFAGCVKKEDERIKIGGLVFSELEESLNTKVNKFEEEYNKTTNEIRFKNFTELLLALETKKVDAIVTNEYIAKGLKEKDDNYFSLEEKYGYTHHMVTRLEDKKLADELSKAIDELTEDGTIDKLIKEYAENIKDNEGLDKIEGEGPTYNVGVTGDYLPFDYISTEGVPSGFNVALLSEIAKKIGCSFNLIQVDGDARLIALETKKVDIILSNFVIENGKNPTSDKVCLTKNYASTKMVYVTTKEKQDKVVAWHDNMTSKLMEMFSEMASSSDMPKEEIDE